MRRIVEQILKVLRSVLSWLGFASAASSTSDKRQLGVSQSALPPSSGGEARETPRREVVEAGSVLTFQESMDDGSVEIVQIQSDRNIGEGETASDAVGTVTAEESVQQKQPVEDEDAGECGVG